MNRTLGILAGLAAAAIWGGMYVVSKVVLEVIPPFALLSLRLVLGAGLLAAWLAWRRQLGLDRKARWRLLALGALGFGLSLGLQFVGTRLSTASNASLVTSASPAFMVLFAALLLGERASGRRIAALVMASAGVVAVIQPGGAEVGSASMLGNLALLGAALTWGLYSVLVKAASRWAGPLQIGLYTFMGGLALSMPAAGVEGQALSIGPLTTGIVLGVLYLGWVSTALAMVLWTHALAKLEASLVSILFFAQPVVGVGLGAALLGERLNLAFWLGAVAIGASLLLAAGPSGSVPGVSRSALTHERSQETQEIVQET
ncbi:MAG TPA: DMT family transporter [Anaerolineales bacterium]|jgi:drug/metabolite transporter (DMT)-like permease